tara:strand:+ start:305 stop:1543 length:1239 start_codon:yes stop_codon:yes gene_type:complete
MKTQTQEIERLNQIERQKELIAQLSEMRQNIDLPPRVMDDLLWAERYRLERNLPCWFMTIPEIMLVYGSALLEMVDDQSMPWKVNGAIDLIIDDECRLINPARSFVHVFVQRQEDLNVEEIKKWLTTSGGFLHEKCQATEMQHLKYANTTTLADAMHRSIMAYMSGVTQIQSSIKKRHPLETTDEKDVQVEFDFFEKLQNESVRVKDEHIAKVRKTSGSLKDPVDLKFDKILTDLNIGMAGFGVNKDDAVMDFGAKGETILKNLLLNDKEFEYVSNAEELIKNNMEFIESYIGKDLRSGGRSHRVKGLSVILRMMSKLTEEQREYFEEFLEAEDINLTDSDWTSQCVHNFATTTAFIRLALQFNQWYREKMEEGNLFTFAWFREELIYINNPEAPAYVRRCLSGKPTHEEIK